MLTVECTSDQLYSCWNCLRLVIKNKMTVGSDDDAFLMEVMTDLARFHKTTTAKIKFTLPFTKMRACWQACKMLLDAKWVPLEKQPPLLEVFSLMGVELQKAVNMESSPDQIEKATMPALTLVK